MIVLLFDKFNPSISSINLLLYVYMSQIQPIHLRQCIKHVYRSRLLNVRNSFFHAHRPGHQTGSTSMQSCKTCIIHAWPVHSCRSIDHPAGRPVALALEFFQSDLASDRHSVRAMRARTVGTCGPVSVRTYTLHAIPTAVIPEVVLPRTPVHAYTAVMSGLAPVDRSGTAETDGVRAVGSPR